MPPMACYSRAFSAAIAIATTKTAFIIYICIIQSALVNCYQNDTSSPTTSLEGGEGGLVFTIPSSIKPNDDPENTLNIVQKARNNEISAEMVTNKTRAMVSCESGEILVRINFTEPFRGVAYADYDRSSPCNFNGEGLDYYEMRLPLKGCGTKQEAPRLFINNVVIRFHRSLELEEDEVKTIVCRYPPPQVPAPPPPGLPARVVNAPPEPAKLTQYEPFVIIAGLLFFALLLAAFGTTSYVTKKQTITPINTPFPIISKNNDDVYVDNFSEITTQEIETTQTLVPFPKISLQTVDDIFTTKIHEIETFEDVTHHSRTIPKAHLERRDFDEVYITNEDEIIEDEILTKQQIALQRRRELQNCDDTYLTNQDEIDDEHTLVSHKMLAAEPKIEIRTIEDTFITKVDEVVENVDTTYLKNRGDQLRDCSDDDQDDATGEWKRQRHLEEDHHQNFSEERRLERSSSSFDREHRY